MSILGRLIFSGAPTKPQKTLLFNRYLPRSIQTKAKSRIAAYVLDKYVSFIKSYEDLLRKNFPAALKAYQVFSVGVKLLKEDTSILFRAFKKVTATGYESLSRKELEIYYQTPKDLMKVAPVLIIGGGIPFCGFVFFLAFYFPRQMLTYHFWSLQQRSEFSLFYHKRKLQLYKPIFRSMQSQLANIKGDPLYKELEHILLSLGSGVHPSVEAILSCKPLFMKPPYSLESLSIPHTVNLLKMYNMHRGWMAKKRLKHRAQLIKLIDAAIVSEGGLEKLSQDELKWNCFFRGLNPINMKQEDIVKWMMTWLSISQEVDSDSYSLLLHCPILLGYNQPSNWSLLRDKRI